MIKATCIGSISEILVDKKEDKNIDKLFRKLDGYDYYDSLMSSDREYKNVVKGYTLRELDEQGDIGEKSYNFYTEDLIKYIQENTISVDNLDIDENNKIVLKKKEEIIKDKKTKAFINKHILFGYELTEIDTDCGHKCYLLTLKKDNKLYIPNDVISPIIRTNTFSPFRTEMNKIRGDLQVFGGEGLINTSDMFHSCVLDILDLQMMDTLKLETIKGMFNSVSAKEIIFGGKFNTSKVKYFDELFISSSIDKLDLSKLNTSNAISFKSMFENSECLDLIIKDLDITNVLSMESMFQDSSFKELDVSNWAICKIKNTKNIFRDCDVVNETKLSDIDRNNKRIMKFRTCWTPEERLANPKNDWYHQMKKVDKYGYGYW